MGTPTQQTWPEGLKLASAMNFRFPTFSSTPLSKIVTNASPEAIDLITAMCSWDPNKRPTAVQVSPPAHKIGALTAASTGPCLGEILRLVGAYRVCLSCTALTPHLVVEVQRQAAQRHCHASSLSDHHSFTEAEMSRGFCF